jgi:very-long-chain (3R)-3-hydroxyacyl-CoA dehydratase
MSSIYLLAYNIISALSWASLLLIYQSSFTLLLPLQTSAVLEILHSLTGLVRTPVLTTTMQVASRLYITWSILYPLPHLSSTLTYQSMVFAWSVTEFIRYSYYASNLFSNPPYALIWMRYTLFYVLYPIGAGSEWWLVASNLKGLEGVYGSLIAGHWIVLAIYVPGFYVMYTHMIKQRKKYLGVDMVEKKTKTK